MEKAAHILNTAIPTNVDLRRLAEAVAGRLMGKRKQLTIKELKELKMGAHYGGSEFLNMIIDGCMTVVARIQSDLPNPVERVRNGQRVGDPCCLSQARQA